MMERSTMNHGMLRQGAAVFCNRFLLTLGYVFAGAACTAATELGINGTQFTVNGTPTFLLGFSYYAGLGAPAEFVRQDLDDFRAAGFNWLRVFANLSIFSDTSAVDRDGQPREPYFGRLKALLDEADRRQMIVDVTLARWESLPTLEAHRRAVETLTRELKPWRNLYFDLANERDLPGSGFVGNEEIGELRQLVKQLDPTRLVTASDCDPDRADLKASLEVARLDFLSPHRWRDPSTVRSSRSWTEQTIATLRELGRVVPLHYQEPFRRGFAKRWEPTVADYLADLDGAIAGGAAGWCFHNGPQDDKADGKPRRSFDLREQRLFDQLDGEERRVLQKLSSQPQR